MKNDSGMKILFDHQIYERQTFGGVSRYFTELYLHLIQLGQVQPEMTVKYSSNIYLRQQIDQYKNISPVEIRGLGKYGFLLRRTLNHLATQKRIKQNQHDLLHPTYYSNRYLHLNKRPLVVTVFDMIHEIYSEGINTTTENKRALCQKADKIIAISESTKTDLIKIFDVDPEKIRVVHLAGGFTPPTEKKSHVELGLPEQYFLYVGGRQSYKNFKRTVEASVSLLEQNNDLHVVCTGKNFTPDELAVLNEFGVASKYQSYFCPEEDFYHLYNNALFFVFPSEYEGFGIPVLESFSADCPCALSNASSLPEVAGDAALFFDPLDVDDMRSKMQSLADDENLRRSLAAKGQERLKSFSWEKTARQTLDVYQELLKR